jgi:dephospho-CoA kinase
MVTGMGQMKTIGLVGGVASGKSLAANAVVELGAVLLDADKTGHLVLADDPDVRQAVLGRWGQSVLGPDGKVDRAAVAKKVFAKGDDATSDREFLENLLHPRIGRRLEQQRDQAAAAGKPAVVLDAPLLLEAGWGPMCDFVIMIDSPREARLARAATRGWTETEFSQREAAQWPTEKKRSSADAVIQNHGSSAELRAAVADFWAQNIAPTSRRS